jgi:hypothetical protein
LLRAAVVDVDAIVRLEAARALAVAPPTGVEAMLDALEEDPQGRVRAVGLEARVALFPAQAEAAYTRHLFDRAVALRSLSQRALATASPSPAERYRDAIRAGVAARLAIALLGICETGDASDAALVRPFLSHRSPRVRVAALRALARHEPGDLQEILYAALGDASPRVSREARTAFLACRNAAAPDRLQDLLTHGTRQVRSHAIALAQTLPRWPRLRFLLGACRSDDTESAEAALRGVELWLAQSSRAVLSPGPEEREAMSRKVAEAGERLPRAVAEQLAFMLRVLT